MFRLTQAGFLEPPAWTLMNSSRAPWHTFTLTVTLTIALKGKRSDAATLHTAPHISSACSPRPPTFGPCLLPL